MMTGGRNVDFDVLSMAVLEELDEDNKKEFKDMMKKMEAAKVRKAVEDAAAKKRKQEEDDAKEAAKDKAKAAGKKTKVNKTPDEIKHLVPGRGLWSEVYCVVTPLGMDKKGKPWGRVGAALLLLVFRCHIQLQPAQPNQPNINQNKLTCRTWEIKPISDEMEQAHVGSAVHVGVLAASEGRLEYCIIAG